MRLTFLGATHEVTGSCYYLEAAGKKFLVDCGMEQGPNIYENKPIPVPASQLDFVLITHAHIDHTGNLPLLYVHGFRGPIYMTPATVALSDIMLRDSAHIQLAEAEWRNRKNRRAGKEDYVTPYTMEDALGVIRLLEGIPYHQRVTLSDGIQIRFLDAGHLLGSASIELWLTEDGVTKKLLFSGDIGNIHQPLINDPEYPESADYVIMESTYGDRSHGPKPDYVPELAKIIQETLDRGGNLVIPSFAVGRTQEMLYFIREIKAEHLVHGHGEFPVYVDSPLAVEATNIFRDHQKECYDSDAAALLAQGINPILFPGLKLSITSDESKAINFNETPKVIISASGMCDAGRIKHHLKHNLWRQESTVLFVGYQAVGTLGRALIGGAKEVKLFQEEVHVNAHIIQFPGMSGHADQEGLLKWAGSLRAKPDRVFVTHGEDKVTELFAEKLWDEFRYPAMAPFSGTVFDLKENEFIEKTVGIPIQKESAANAGTLRTRSSGNAVFDRLVAAGQRLLTVITRNKGGANKDLSKFADQINSLCDKWDR